VRGIDAMGGGDPKLFGAIGCWFGWRPLAAVMLGAAVLGLMLVLGQRVRGAKIAADQPLPLGTLLASAAMVMWITRSGFSMDGMLV
jgi:leader peptidase (prepilin peptidase)/N-methyltransferase